MSKSLKSLIVVMFVITAVSVAAAVFMAARHGDPDEQDQKEAVQTPSHLSVQNGQTVINLDAQAQAREGIRVAPVTQRSTRAELRGTAVLLAVSDLAVSRNSYIAARTTWERDQVDLNLARARYERIKTLYEQNQNMSLMAMQDAEAAYRKSQAQVKADEQNARLQLDAVRQRWGSAVAGWVASDTPMLESVLEQRQFLSQVILPPGEVVKPPATLSLSLSPSASRLAQASFVSPFPRVNPQIQGVSFLYVASGRPEMAADMNLVARISAGRWVRGSVVPDSAVVFWQGKAWAYEATSPDAFTRREVPTGNPVAGGYLVPKAVLPPGAKLVIAGAQALLSEEFRGRIQQED